MREDPPLAHPPAVRVIAETRNDRKAWRQQTPIRRRQDRQRRLRKPCHSVTGITRGCGLLLLLSLLPAHRPGIDEGVDRFEELGALSPHAPAP